MGKKYAIVIPYRDRKEHLDVLLKALEKYKEPDALGNTVTIIVMEQNNDNLFNRGQLFNASVCKEYDYYIFHDVDLIPDPEINYIREYPVPTHLSCYCEQFDFKLMDGVEDYKQSKMFGGVIAMSVQDFFTIGGFLTSI